MPLEGSAYIGRDEVSMFPIIGERDSFILGENTIILKLEAILYCTITDIYQYKYIGSFWQVGTFIIILYIYNLIILVSIKGKV